MANLTGNQYKTLLTNYKDNSGGANDTQILEWLQFLNQFFYHQVVNVNPDDYLTTRTIKTIADTPTYTLPSDFKTLQHGGVYAVDTGTDYYALNYDSQTVNFTTVPQTITQATTGATGTLAEVVDYGTTGTLRLTNVVGTFDDNYVITGSTEGSATANGAAEGFVYTNRKVAVTGFGSYNNGYWVDLTNLTKTPTPSTSEVYIMRYLPRLSSLATLATETLIPTPDFDEFVRDSVDVYWNQWRQSPDEFTAQQRATASLKDLLKQIRKTPGVMKFSRRDALYSFRSSERLTSASE